MVEIKRESPMGADLTTLFARHAAANQEDVPPESNHMLGPEGLDQPSIAFFVLRENGVPMAMGAFKRLSDHLGEIKSMHVLAEARGRGYSRQLLSHIEVEARQEGVTRLSLETGVQSVFAAAVGLYEAFGYQTCPPFGDYSLDPNSIFMTKALSA